MNEKVKGVLKIIWIGFQIAVIPLAILVGYLVSRRPTTEDSRIDDLRGRASTTGSDLQGVRDNQLKATESAQRLDTLIAEGKSILQRIRERG